MVNVEGIAGQVGNDGTAKGNDECNKLSQNKSAMAEAAERLTC